MCPDDRHFRARPAVRLANRPVDRMPERPGTSDTLFQLLVFIVENIRLLRWHLAHYEQIETCNLLGSYTANPLLPPLGSAKLLIGQPSARPAARRRPGQMSRLAHSRKTSVIFGPIYRIRKPLILAASEFVRKRTVCWTQTRAAAVGALEVGCGSTPKRLAEARQSGRYLDAQPRPYTELHNECSGGPPHHERSPGFLHHPRRHRPRSYRPRRHRHPLLDEIAVNRR